MNDTTKLTTKLGGAVALLALMATTAMAQVSATFTWDPSPDVVTNYNLSWGPTNTTTTNVVICGNVLTYTLTNQLTSGNGYWFYVQPVDTNGLAGVPSNLILYTAPWPSPTAVSGLTYTTFISTRNPSSLLFNWNAVTNVALSNYQLYSGYVNTNTGAYLSTNTSLIPPGQLNATVTGLLPGSNYWFAVSAISTHGVEGGKSTEMRYTVYPLPPRPSGSFRQTVLIVPQ